MITWINYKNIINCYPVNDYGCLNYIEIRNDSLIISGFYCDYMNVCFRVNPNFIIS